MWIIDDYFNGYYSEDMIESQVIIDVIVILEMKLAYYHPRVLKVLVKLKVE